MKRETYRREKKKLDKEKKNRKVNYTNQPVEETSYSQDTAEFDPKELRQAAQVPETEYQDLDTNEIYFENQRKKQWLWSGPNKKGNRIYAFILVIIAILLIILVGPILWDMLRSVLLLTASIEFN